MPWLLLSFFGVLFWLLFWFLPNLIILLELSALQGLALNPRRDWGSAKFRPLDPSRLRVKEGGHRSFASFCGFGWNLLWLGYKEKAPDGLALCAVLNNGILPEKNILVKLIFTVPKRPRFMWLRRRGLVFGPA